MFLDDPSPTKFRRPRSSGKQRIASLFVKSGKVTTVSFENRPTRCTSACSRCWRLGASAVHIGSSRTLLVRLHTVSWWTRLESEVSRHRRKPIACQLVKDLTTVKQGKATAVQDHSGKYLTEEQEILNRWTEYCFELYNHKANGDPSVLNCP